MPVRIACAGDKPQVLSTEGNTQAFPSFVGPSERESEGWSDSGLSFARMSDHPTIVGPSSDHPSEGWPAVGPSFAFAVSLNFSLPSSRRFACPSVCKSVCSCPSVCLYACRCFCLLTDYHPSSCIYPAACPLSCCRFPYAGAELGLRKLGQPNPSALYPAPIRGTNKMRCILSNRALRATLWATCGPPVVSRFRAGSARAAMAETRALEGGTLSFSLSRLRSSLSSPEFTWWVSGTRSGAPTCDEE